MTSGKISVVRMALLVGALAPGVLAMPAKSQAQPKKAPIPMKAEPKAPAKEAPKLKPPYTEVVTYEGWSDRVKRFGPPIENVWAWRKTMANGDQGIYIRVRDKVGGPPWLGSRITDKDGVSWIVTKTQNVGPDYLCYVKKAN